MYLSGASYLAHNSRKVKYFEYNIHYHYPKIQSLIQAAVDNYILSAFPYLFHG